MKDKLKNPNLYYILMPVVAGIWAILAGFVFYPKSVKAWQEDAKPDYKQAQELMLKIIKIEPERLLTKEIKTGKDGEIDFGSAVDTLTQLLDIHTSKYTLSVQKPVKKAGKKSRTAAMTIKEIDIESTGRFISAMLALSPDIKCDVVSIDKAKSGKDNWNITIRMSHVY